MRRQIAFLLCVGSFLICSDLKSQMADGAIAEGVKKYILEQDHPEVFANSYLTPRIEAILNIDIDNDGKKEIVVQFSPHYRQSPTLVIYKISAETGFKRVMEGLAPGMLQKISGDYLDSHKSGEAVDFAAGQNKVGEDDTVLKVALANFGGVVAYRNFYHADGRKGQVSYIDMKNVVVPLDSMDCSSFEFSKVHQIAAGNIREDSSKNYLAAWVGSDIYIYLIRGISGAGMLDKKVWIVKAPTNFNGFIPGQGLNYKTPTGTALLSLAN